MSVSPNLHAGLLGAATVAALVFAGVILARNPRSTAARMHATYGGVVAWWFFAMAVIASGAGEVETWGRLLHVGVAMLIGVAYHLNVATAEVAHEHRGRIRAHYAAAAATMVFCLTWPDLFDTPHEYSWGPYPAYTWWGLVPMAVLGVMMTQVIAVYRRAAHRAVPGTAYEEKVRAFLRGNVIVVLAFVDFLPVFGVGIYPFGYAVMTSMFAATAFGSIRYRLIEITPEFAADEILETLPDAVFAIDSQGLVRIANDSAARLLGCELREVTDRPIDDIAPALLAELGPDLSQLTTPREISFTGADGHRRFLRAAGTRLIDQRRAHIGHIVVLHDLTEQREAEAEKDELEGWVRHGQKLETLGVMAGGIAHDFNNLLMAIMASAEVARVRLDDRDAIDAQLRRIVRASEHATDLTSQMLTYAGQGTTIETAVDLNELAGDISELIDTAISKKATVELHFAEDLPTVVGDQSQLSQVLLNLITNASDALEGAVGTITVRTGVLGPDDAIDGQDAGAPYVFLEVADTGVGIDDDTRERMFDPFFTTKFDGRGLGLATVLGIVQAHGGRIRVDTEAGRGTTFTVALPAATAEDVSSPQSRPDVTVVAAGLALVADDEAGVREVAHEMLATAGFEVAEADNGSDAVRVFRERAPEISLVLLDVTMPEMDGHEAVREIRALSDDVPIILMSGYAEATAKPQSDHRTWFLAKPFHFDELTTTMSEALKG